MYVCMYVLQHLSRIVVGVVRVHERYDEPNGLQKGCQAFASVQSDAFPERAKHRIEGLNAVREGGLCQRRQTQSSDGAHFLLLVDQTVLGYVNLLNKTRITTTRRQIQLVWVWLWFYHHL